MTASSQTAAPPVRVSNERIAQELDGLREDIRGTMREIADAVVRLERRITVLEEARR